MTFRRADRFWQMLVIIVAVLAASALERVESDDGELTLPASVSIPILLFNFSCFFPYPRVSLFLI